MKTHVACHLADQLNSLSLHGKLVSRSLAVNLSTDAQAGKPKSFAQKSSREFHHVHLLAKHTARLVRKVVVVVAAAAVLFVCLSDEAICLRQQQP